MELQKDDEAISHVIRMVEGDVRKTALGASSPAKPALHIPELHPTRQSCSDSINASLYALGLYLTTIWTTCDDWCPTKGGRIGIRLGRGAYPLSMTRAATSSVDCEIC